MQAGEQSSVLRPYLIFLTKHIKLSVSIVVQIGISMFVNTAILACNCIMEKNR